MSFLLFQLKNQKTSGSIRTFCNQKLQEDSQVSIRRWIRRINTGNYQGRALCRSKWDKSKSHREILKNPKIKYLVEILKLAGYLSNCLCKSVMIIQTANLVQLCTKDWHWTLSENDLLRLEFWYFSDLETRDFHTYIFCFVPGSRKENRKKAQCSGDSGGPLVFEVKSLTSLSENNLLVTSLTNSNMTSEYIRKSFSNVWFALWSSASVNIFSTPRKKRSMWSKESPVGELFTTAAVLSRIDTDKKFITTEINLMSFVVWAILAIWLFGLFLSDPSPIIVYPCRSFTRWLTEWLVNCPSRWSLYLLLTLYFDHLVGDGDHIYAAVSAQSNRETGTAMYHWLTDSCVEAWLM